MAGHYVLSDYVSAAIAGAAYDKLEDGIFSGRTPSCQGVVAFGTVLRECEEELRYTLEDWILLGFGLGHLFPVINGIDLDKEPAREPVDAV